MILLKAFASLRDFFLIYMPGALGVKSRAWYYGRKFKSCGKNLIVDVGVVIEGAEHISVGDNVYIDKYCVISTGTKVAGRVQKKENARFSGAPGEITIGSNVHLVQFCVLMGYGGIRIGDNCTLSAGSKIYSLTNLSQCPDRPGERVSIMPYSQAPFLQSPVTLAKNVWLGLHAVLMPGVAIEQDSFVATNSVVMGTFPENSHIAGQPATRVKPRYS